MLNRILATILFILFITLGVSGQVFHKDYWKDLADRSKIIVVGTAEENFMVGRPEKFKLSSDNPNPTERDLYVGRFFRIKITKTLKGKIKTEKVGENKYANVFLYWISGVPSMSAPIILTGAEYVLFLVPNNDKELEGKETIEFNKTTYDIISKPFDYKSSYLIVDNFRGGAVEIGDDKDKLIKTIKKAI